MYLERNLRMQKHQVRDRYVGLDKLIGHTPSNESSWFVVTAYADAKNTLRSHPD